MNQRERERPYLMQMPAAGGRDGRRLSRRRFLKILGVTAAAGAGSYWNAFHYSPYNPVVSRRRITLEGLPEAFSGLRIAQLTDLHHSDIVPLGYLDECIEITNALNPDLVVLTGDYVTMDEDVGRPEIRKRFVEPLESLLGRLRADLGVYAVMGNHDVAAAYHEVTEVMARAGIPLLQDSNILLERAGQHLPLVGLRDFGTEVIDLRKAFEGIDPAAPAIVLMHNPDLFPEMEDPRNALIFAGHTHGGQVRIPFYGALPGHIPSRYGSRYAEGLFQEGGRTMLVNRGLGVIRTRVRINCRPEIALVTLG